MIRALGEWAGVEVVAAVQFADGSLNPIAVLRGSLRPDPDRSQRFEIGDGVIVVRREDLSDASWVEGRGEEPALLIDLHNVQITVGPASEDMADLLD